MIMLKTKQNPHLWTLEVKVQSVFVFISRNGAKYN